MVKINTIDINPPLLNSSCAWSSDLEQLKALYHSPYTGAITTRTATLKGYNETESNTVTFATASTSSINSYGYSPHPLAQYLDWINSLLTTATTYKPIIISITSDVDDPITLGIMVNQVQELRRRHNDIGNVDGKARIAIELNTSCPNIKHAPPPAYVFESLGPLLQVLSKAYVDDPTLTIGLKLPPFVYEQQFHSTLHHITTLISDGGHRDSETMAISMISSSLDGSTNTPSSNIISNESTRLFISFLTSTNTLGNALLFSDQSVPLTKITISNGDTLSSSSSKSTGEFALPTGLGGLAGEALHPLALGNVYRFSQIIKGLKDTCPPASRIKIIGVGGVTSKEAKDRMFKAGADVVACATFFGKEGTKAFEILA